MRQKIRFTFDIQHIYAYRAFYSHLKIIQSINLGLNMENKKTKVFVIHDNLSQQDPESVSNQSKITNHYEAQDVTAHFRLVFAIRFAI